MGLVERFNGTMGSMIRSFSGAEKESWDTLLPLAAFAYNTAIHSTTGVTPYEAMYGHKCTLPFEAALLNALEDPMVPTTDRVRLVQEHIANVRPKMATIWASMVDNVRRTQTEQARRYNRRHRSSRLEPGDLALLHIFDQSHHRGPRKFQCNWYGPYRVKERVNDLLYHLEPAHPSVNPRLVTAAINRQRLKKIVELPERYQGLDRELTLAPSDIDDLELIGEELDDVEQDPLMVMSQPVPEEQGEVIPDDQSVHTDHPRATI